VITALVGVDVVGLSKSSQEDQKDAQPGGRRPASPDLRNGFSIQQTSYQPSGESLGNTSKDSLQYMTSGHVRMTD